MRPVRSLKQSGREEIGLPLRSISCSAEHDNIDQGKSEYESTAQPKHQNLVGVKDLHGLDKVMEGGAVVLTLKDQSILADSDINQEVDMLENVEIAEVEEIQSPNNIVAKIPGKIGAQPLHISRTTTTNGTSVKLTSSTVILLVILSTFGFHGQSSTR
ncbi:hypothetical protein RJ639_021126 [Escallonia herrerae]|uniref:Uncharacterized protein n=1 Tax=Escallonia herrerae TaxID=1293975 RepID=A0AA88V4N9_9ASTE|nr:hypothetical protein RJ639_021126 [Escallonia herrerae]